MDNSLYHYGTPKHSGRYPWGSGDNPYHHQGKKEKKKSKNNPEYENISAKYKSKPMYAMTNQELRDATERKHLENEYKKAYADTKKKGRSYLREQLGKASSDMVANSLKKIGSAYIEKNLGERLGLTDYMKTGNKDKKK